MQKFFLAREVPERLLMTHLITKDTWKWDLWQVWYMLQVPHPWDVSHSGIELCVEWLSACWAGSLSGMEKKLGIGIWNSSGSGNEYLIGISFGNGNPYYAKTFYGITKNIYDSVPHCFLPSADSKAVCRRLRKPFLTHPPLPPSRQLWKSPSRQLWKSVVGSLLWHIWWQMTLDNDIWYKCDLCYKCDTHDQCHTVTQFCHFLTTFLEFFDNFFDIFLTTFLTYFWQLFDNFLQLFDHFLKTFWQLSDNLFFFFDNFLTTFFLFGQLFDNFYQVRQGCTWSRSSKSPSPPPPTRFRILVFLHPIFNFVIFFQLFGHFLATFWQLFDNFFTTFLATFLTTFDNFDNFLTTFWQKF
jgi:hypothetical protein